MKKTRPVLLVEDAEDYAALIQEELRSVEIPNPVLVVHSPDAAIAYLDPEGKFGDRSVYPLPCLMLLDLKFPEKSGFDVLRWLKDRPVIKNAMHIVVLSGVGQPAEVQLAYDLGTQFYMNKSDYLDPTAAARYLKNCWLSTFTGDGDGR